MDKKPIAISPQTILSTIDRISKETGLNSFVLFGSSSVIIYNQHRLRLLPDFIKKTADVDLSTTFKGQSVEIYNLEMKALGTIFKNFGEDTDFEKKNEFYVELVNRGIVGMAPQGWEERAKLITTEGATKITVLHPLDCAALKLEIGRDKDIEWLAQGFSAKLFLPHQLEKHVQGHARYKESEKKIAENLSNAAKRSKILMKDRGR